MPKLGHPDMDQNTFEFIFLRDRRVLTKMSQINKLYKENYMIKLQRAVYFLILHSFHIKNNPLEMQNQIIWALGNRRLLLDFPFIVAHLAEIILNSLFLNKAGETFLKILLVFDLQREIIKLFIPFFLVLATHTGDGIAGLPSENIVHQLTQIGIFDLEFYFVE